MKQKPPKKNNLGYQIKQSYTPNQTEHNQNPKVPKKNTYRHTPTNQPTNRPQKSKNLKSKKPKKRKSKKNTHTQRHA